MVTSAAPARWLAGLALGLACVAATGQPVVLGAVEPMLHTVRKGDTLSTIARRYGVSVAALVRANRLSGAAARLPVGMRLTVPGTAGVAHSGAAAGASRAAMTTAKTPRRLTPSTKSPRRLRMPPNMVLAVPDLPEPVPLFTWPVDGSVSSNFGRRRMGWHRGIDIVATPGAPIMAAAPGLVVASGVEDRYGRVVKVAHDNGFTSVYAHNAENLVELGGWVAAGQVIATVGRSGHATSEHLHFEIRHEGFAYNPLYLLPLPPQVLPGEDLDTEDDDEHE